MHYNQLVTSVNSLVAPACQKLRKQSEQKPIGLKRFFVSGIRLGVMTFGVGANKKAAFRFMDKAFDVGIDFFDIV